MNLQEYTYQVEREVFGRPLLPGEPEIVNKWFLQEIPLYWLKRADYYSGGRKRAKAQRMDGIISDWRKRFSLESDPAPGEAMPDHTPAKATAEQPDKLRVFLNGVEQILERPLTQSETDVVCRWFERRIPMRWVEVADSKTTGGRGRLPRMDSLIQYWFDQGISVTTDPLTGERLVPSPDSTGQPTEWQETKTWKYMVGFAAKSLDLRLSNGMPVGVARPMMAIQVAMSTFPPIMGADLRKIGIKPDAVGERVAQLEQMQQRLVEIVMKEIPDIADKVELLFHYGIGDAHD